MSSPTRKGRKLRDPERAKAIVSWAWDRIKTDGGKPAFPYIGVVAIVDRLIEGVDDATDFREGLVLCHKMALPFTRKNIAECATRVNKGRQGVTTYR